MMNKHELHFCYLSKAPITYLKGKLVVGIHEGLFQSLDLMPCNLGGSCSKTSHDPTSWIRYSGTRVLGSSKLLISFLILHPTWIDSRACESSPAPQEKSTKQDCCFFHSCGTKRLRVCLLGKVVSIQILRAAFGNNFVALTVRDLCRKVLLRPPITAQPFKNTNSWHWIIKLQLQHPRCRPHRSLKLQSFLQFFSLLCLNPE